MPEGISQRQNDISGKFWTGASAGGARTTFTEQTAEECEDLAVLRMEEDLIDWYGEVRGGHIGTGGTGTACAFAQYSNASNHYDYYWRKTSIQTHPGNWGGGWPEYAHFHDANYGGALMWDWVQEWETDQWRTSDLEDHNNEEQCDLHDACDAAGVNTDQQDYISAEGVTTVVTDTYTSDKYEELWMDGVMIYRTDWDFDLQTMHPVGNVKPYPRYYKLSDDDRHFVFTHARTTGSTSLAPPEVWDYNHVKNADSSEFTLTRFDARESAEEQVEIAGEKGHWLHEIPGFSYQDGKIYGKGKYRLVQRLTKTMNIPR